MVDSTNREVASPDREESVELYRSPGLIHGTPSPDREESVLYRSPVTVIHGTPSPDREESVLYRSPVTVIHGTPSPDREEPVELCRSPATVIHRTPRPLPIVISDTPTCVDHHHDANVKRRQSPHIERTTSVAPESLQNPKINKYTWESSFNPTQTGSSTEQPKFQIFPGLSISNCQGVTITVTIDGSH
jgi:hypothetical protein